MRHLLTAALILLGICWTTGCDSFTPPPPVNSIHAIDQGKLAAVEAVLKSDQVLAGCVIKVTAQNDLCVLEGQVPTQDAKERAEAMVLRVDGITKVANHLQVVPDAGANPNEKTDIR